MSCFKPSLAALSAALFFVLAPRAASAQAPNNAPPPDTIAELVAANHVLAKLKLVDAFGHITMRDPGNPQRYFMARSMAPADVTEKDILTLDLDSNQVSPKDGGVGPSLERFIHGEIYKARPDVNAVVHTHSPAVIPFSVSKMPLRPIMHTGAFLSPSVPIFDPRTVDGPNNLLVANQKTGKALADALGKSTAVFIRGHGDAVVAPNVGLAVYRAYFTEVSAQLLLQAKQLGEPVTYIEPDEAALANDLRNAGYIRQWDLWKKEMAN